MPTDSVKAVFLDFDTVSSGDLDTQRLQAAVDELTLLDHDETRVAQRLEGRQVALVNTVRMTRTVLECSPALRLIALAATGTDNVDLAAARELGIAVCNVRDYCTASVAQHAWGLILALNQHLTEYVGQTLSGAWSQDETRTMLARPIRELSGLTFGVVGWGNLGRGTARLAEAFGMRVIIASRPGGAPQPGRVPLDELLMSADIVSLHCPLTDATRGLIGTRELALMKPDALLINTARGGLIESQALAAALKAGRIGGAGLDVLEQEPPPLDDPLLDPGVPNLLVTPHVAWSAGGARQRCIDEMTENVLDFRRGGRRGRVV